MKKLFLTAVIASLFSSCIDEPPILVSSEYTIVDTTYTAKNGFGFILYYDVILLNRYDSSYHAGSISGGKLTNYNPRPLSFK